MIAFHNLYLQLEYLENINRIFSCGLSDIYNEFFPKKIVDNFNLIEKFFNELDNKNVEAEVNHKFLDDYLKKTNRETVKDATVSAASLF